MNLDVIKNKMKFGTATISEIAAAARQDQYILFNALLDNNLEDVNVALRTKLGNERNLPFAANRRAIEKVISGYIETRNGKAIQTIIDEFDFNPNAKNYTVKVLPLVSQPDSLAARTSFSAGAGEVGTGIGNFLGPIFNSLGSENSTTTESTSKPSSTSTIVIISGLVIFVAAMYFMFFYKPDKASS
jgi:hypothetical protein